jgi:hypothetical protein
MTLKQSLECSFEKLIVRSLIFEYQRTLLALRSDLSRPSALLRGQVPVHFAYERADKFSRPQRPARVSTLTYRRQLRFGFPGGEKCPPAVSGPTTLPQLHR